jgi:DNA-binding beta-propeller fold protein YncE
VNSFGDTYVVDKNDNHIHYFTQDLRSMHFSKWNNLTFTEPSGVAIDTLNNVYITSSKNTINEFTGDGHPIEDGLSVHNLTSPNGVAVDSLGNVYVSDTGKNRVQKFSPDGGSNYTAKSWGSLGSNAGQFNSPKGIAVDPSGYVYVADTGNNRVQKFDNNGTFITKWGSPGPRNGQFAQPFGIAVDPSGHVYVADTGNSRIQVFAPSNNTTN